MSRIRRLLGALLAVSTAAAGAALIGDSPAGAATARPATSTAARGYTVEGTNLLGVSPGPLTVWLDPKTVDAATVASVLGRAATELRGLGFSIRYAGTGTPKLREGLIDVTSNASGCTGGGTGGDTNGYTNANVVAITGRAQMILDARIVLCPTIEADVLTGTVLHELGHALGLGHLNVKYDGQYQVMYPYGLPGVTDYQAGDRNGLRWLATSTRTHVRPRIAPAGRLQHEPIRAGSGPVTVSVRGWAVLQYYPKARVRILVTVDGRTVANRATDRTSASVNRKRHVTGKHAFRFTVGLPRSGGHTYCVTAVSPIYKKARTPLGCVVFLVG